MDAPAPLSMVALLVKFKNLMLLLFQPRHLTNVRWADILSDSSWNAVDFKSRFYRVYLRWSSKYRFHPQQMNYNAARNIDPNEELARRMAAHGTGEYYKALPSSLNASGIDKSADLTTHQQCESLGDLLQVVESLAKLTSHENGELAAEVFAKGLTREVLVDNDEDWEKLRVQLRDNDPNVQLGPDADAKRVLPVAVSYKSGDETFIENVVIRPRGGVIDDELRKALEDSKMESKKKRATDFVNDHRWDQLVRGVREYARAKKYAKISLWVDRVRNIGRSPEEKDDMYNKLNWTEVGLYAYMLMPTMRVFCRTEHEYETAFWRSVEMTLAVSGKGLICDDYMLRHYDILNYDHTLYHRLRNGIIVLGGTNKYVRSTILAFATMIITDGLSISKSNEHPETISSIVQWKSWAIRSIAQDAFYALAPAVPVRNKPPSVDFNAFKLLSSWEHDLCHSEQLVGGSYLNVTLERSQSWGRASPWNGVSEWIGMVQDAYFMDKESREDVLNYLNQNVIMKMYAAPSGHTVSQIRLQDGRGSTLKSLVVETSRFSTATHGQAIAVADATGHHGESIIPRYLRFRRNPDGDQQWCHGKFGRLERVILPMSVGLSWSARLFVGLALLVLNIALGVVTKGVFVGIFVVFCSLIWTYSVFVRYTSPLSPVSQGTMVHWWASRWPWADYSDVGEALFHNVLLHSLFGSGIKKKYRRVRTSDYRSIQWH